MKKILLAALCCCLLCSVAAQTPSLEEQFRRPTGDARPWTLWYWMFGAVSDEAIRADLEAMASAGLGGAYLVTIRSSDDPRAKALGEAAYHDPSDQLTDAWRQRLRTAFTEADRLGLQLGVHICDGFALAGGPWNTPAESMQRVVSADTVIRVNRPISFLLPLPRPERNHGYYEDIALVALPVKGGATLHLTEEGRAVVRKPASTAAAEGGRGVDDLHNVVAMPARDDEPTLVPTLTWENLDPKASEKNRVSVDERGTIRAGAPCRVDYTFAEPVTCRNIEIILGGNNYQAHRLTLSASSDGTHFRFVKQLVPARHGWQNTDFQTTHAIPPTTARIFRFEWTPEGSEAGSEDLDAAKWKPNLKIARIRLHATPRLHQWEGKAGLVWRVAEATTPEELTAEDCVQLDEVIDLTDRIDGDHAAVRLPEGRWRILRLGHTTTGHMNETAGAGRGLECDKFSRTAVAKQIDNWFGRIYRTIDPEVARRVLKVLYIDSWECGSQNWSETFAAEFEARRGYALRPWLPLLAAGIPMVSAERSEKVLRDVRETIAELVHDVFYDVIAQKADEYGCRFTAETVAPTMVCDGMYHYDKVDLPMGEFWFESPTHDKPNDMMDAVCGARVYGKRIISAEGFTTLRGVWNETPAMLKPMLDRNYALGLNRLVYHVMTHNPWFDRRPGMTLDGIGLFFQRDNTWFKHGAPALSGYAARCQALLQYGMPVTDIAVFTGEEVPRRSILPDRLVPSLPGLFGAERVESERIRLKNEGQPLRVKPVGVTHSANMADPERWIDPLRGYAYDSFNRDALLRLARAEGGRMVLPGGASYRVLVIPAARPMNPETPMSDEVRAKIDALKAAGVVVPEIPYTADDLTAYGLERDAVVPKGVAWTHRRSESDDTDIYFISNQQHEARRIAVSLRTAGRVPELWNPLTGEIADAAQWRVEAGRTEVELSLDACGSVFVVFRRAGSPQERPRTTRSTVLERPLDLLRMGDWWLTFDLGSEGVRTERVQRLFDWSQSAEERLRYYSGTVTCRTTFRWKGRPKGRVVLALGEVHDVAAVTVNGRPCGVAWTAPYEVDITEALRRGQNSLVIEVSNTWANALLGAELGKAPFRGIWTNAPYRRKEQTLLPAGLTGELWVKEVQQTSERARRERR